MSTRAGIARKAHLCPNGSSEFAITVAASQPLSVVTGPDRKSLICTEYTAGRCLRAEPSSLVQRAGAGNHHPYGITTGPDGKLWFTDPVIVNGTAVTAAVGIWRDSRISCHRIRRAARDRLRFRWQSLVRRIRYQRDRSDHHRRAEVALSASSRPESVASRPDGMLWGSRNPERTGSRASSTGFSITEFAVPTSNSVPCELRAPMAHSPSPSRSEQVGADHHLRSDPRDRIGPARQIPANAFGIWTAEYGCNKVAVIKSDNSVQEFSTPTSTADPMAWPSDRTTPVWVTEAIGNKLFPHRR